MRELQNCEQEADDKRQAGFAAEPTSASAAPIKQRNSKRSGSNVDSNEAAQRRDESRTRQIAD